MKEKLDLLLNQVEVMERSISNFNERITNLEKLDLLLNQVEVMERSISNFNERKA